MMSHCWMVPEKDYIEHTWGVTKLNGIVIIPFGDRRDMIFGDPGHPEWRSVSQEYPMGWYARIEKSIAVGDVS